MQAPVVAEKGTGFFLDMSNTTFIRWDKANKDVVFGTPMNTYRIARSVQDMAAALSGTYMVRVEQTIIVNMNRVRRYDKKNHILHFETAGSEQMDSCYVSRSYRKNVLEYLGIL